MSNHIQKVHALSTINYSEKKYFSIGVLDKYALGLVQNINDKYIFPEDLTLNIILTIKRISENEYIKYNCNYYILINFSFENNILNLLNIDSNPLITEEALFTTSALFAGLNFESLIKKIGSI